MTMNLNKPFWVYSLLALPFLLCSCGGSNNDPTPPDPPEPPVVTEGRVSLGLASGDTPGALSYYFYGSDSKLAHGPLSCDGQGNYSNDKFAVGSYRVLAVSASCPGVELRDMDSHSGASVCLSASPAGRSANSANLTLVSQPGVAYSAVVSGEVKITADATASHTPVVTLLTQSLSLPFSLENGLGGDVVSIDGFLQGVCPSVNLSTGVPVLSVSDCENTAVAFSATGEGASRSATVSLFGLCNPLGGEAYTNTLRLAVTMANGNTEELTVDLTDVLTDAISENKGSLPVDFELPVQIERTVIGLAVLVGDWSVGGESEKELGN